MKIIVLFAFLLLPVLAQAEPRTLTFDVFRNNSPIGTHTVTITPDGAFTRVNVAIDFRVRVLGITVYRYKHRNEEFWMGETLISMQSDTNDDGKAFQVTVQKLDDGYRITNNDGEYMASAPLYTSSYWLASMVTQPRLLDTQDGTLLELSFIANDSEQVPVGEGTVNATPFTITGDLNLTLWYSDAGEWVGLRFPRDDGSIIDYRRKE